MNDNNPQSSEIKDMPTTPAYDARKSAINRCYESWQKRIYITAAIGAVAGVLLSGVGEMYPLFSKSYAHETLAREERIMTQEANRKKHIQYLEKLCAITPIELPEGRPKISMEYVTKANAHFLEGKADLKRAVKEEEKRLEEFRKSAEYQEVKRVQKARERANKLGGYGLLLTLGSIIAGWVSQKFNRRMKETRLGILELAPELRDTSTGIDSFIGA